MELLKNQFNYETTIDTLKIITNELENSDKTAFAMPIATFKLTIDYLEKIKNFVIDNTSN